MIRVLNSFANFSGKLRISLICVLLRSAFDEYVNFILECDVESITYGADGAYFLIMLVHSMAEFEKQVKLSKIKENPYRAVLAWFMKKYENVNDYKKFFEELNDKETNNGFDSEDEE